MVKVNDYQERKVSINDYTTPPNPENRNRPPQRYDTKQQETPMELVKNNSGTSSCSAMKNTRNY